MAKRRLAAAYIFQRKVKKGYGIITESFNIHTTREDISDFYLLEILQLFVSNRKFQYLRGIIDQIQNRNKKNLIIKNISLKLIHCNKLELSSEILQFINLDGEEFPGMIQWDIVLNRVIGIVKKGKINLALALVAEQINDFSNKCDALLHIAQTLFEKNKQKSGLQIIEKTVENISSTGSAYNKGEVLVKIISLLLKQSLYENAIKVFELITDDFWSFKDQGNIELAKYFVQNEIYDQAIIHFAKLSTIENKLTIPLHVTNHRGVDLRKILPIFFHCLTKTEKSVESKGRDILSSEIVSDYLKLGCFDRAQKLASFIESNTIKCECLIEISSNSIASGGGNSEVVINKAIRAGEVIDEEFEKCEILSKLSAIRIKQGAIENAESLLNEAIVLVKDLMEPWNFMALYKLYPLYIEIGKRKFIIDFTKKIIEDSFDDFGAKLDLIKQLAKFGHLEDSRNLLNDLEIMLEKIEGMIAIANGLYEKSEISEADLIIEDALRLTRKMDFEEDKFKAFGIISNFYFNQRQLLKADAIIEEGIQYTQKIKNDPDIFYKSISHLAIELANQRKYTQAILLSKEILDTELKDQTFRSICIECVKYDEWEIAQEASAEINKNEIKYVSWQNIGEKYIREKGLNESIFCIKKISNEKTRTSFLRGIVNSIKVIECTKEIFKSINCYYINDISSMDTLLYKYLLNEVFFQKINTEKHQELSAKVGSIQWAIDIKTQLPN